MGVAGAGASGLLVTMRPLPGYKESGSSLSQPHQTGKRSRRLVRWLSNPGPKLSQRVLHAGLWSFALRLVERGFGFVRTIILARLLAPEDFGLMGIAMLMVSLMEAFTQTGFSAALIQKKGDIRPYLDTAWTIDLFRQGAVAMLLLLCAPLIATFFEAPAATSIVRVTAVTVLISGLTNIGIVYFQKDLEFQKRFAYQASQTLADITVGITLAFLLRSAWALVFGSLAAAVVRVLASYILHSHRPRVRLDWAKAKELYLYGRWVLLNSAIFFVLLRGDGAVVGKLLGPAALGLYQMGRNVAEMVTREIAQVVSTVAFPAYSQTQDDMTRLRRAYFLTFDVVGAVLVPATVVIALLAHPITNVVLGEKWGAVASVLPALAVSACVRAIGATGASLFLATGRPRLDAQMSVMRAIVMFSLIVPFTLSWGLTGTALAVMAGSVCIIPFYLWFTARALKMTLLEMGRRMEPLTLLGVVTALATLASSQVVDSTKLPGLVAAVAFVGLACLVTVFLMWQLSRTGPLRAITLLRSGP